ncbi:hypothetical protein [Flavisphingomonas formosensis]|uniref:hypothetical protein n=1 Tax=Flavisphingomonas formosensis TaxID=861534 RepID=UPI0012F83C19|nr:hypothetical protein [Sphingomonas formosensis]
MQQAIVQGLEWYGAVAGAVAALIVSLDLGRRWTGIGFVIFVSSSLTLIGWGFLKPDAQGIGTQNIVLLIINLIGVYRYIIRKKDPA